jgi:hypothetical protein
LRVLVEKGAENPAWRGPLDQLAKRFSAQFVRRVAQRASPGVNAQELEQPAWAHTRHHHSGIGACFPGAGAQNQDQIGEQAHLFA